MSFPDGVWVLQLIVHCSDQSVWRWIRKARFLMGSLMAGGGFDLSGRSHWKPLAVSWCCCWPVSYIFPLNSVFPCTSSWGRPLVWWTLVSHLKHWTQKRFLFLFYMRKYFILYWCKQWWQLLVVSLHRCQTNIEIRGIKIQFCWAGSTPGSPESSKVSVFTEIWKKDTFEPVNHNFSWESEGACFSLIFRIYYYTHN